MHSMPQRALAEFFGTAALVLVGPGSVIATLTLAGKAVPAVTEADLLAISFAFGTTFWTDYIPVYLVSGFVGAAAAAFLYDFLANPRLGARPIVEAVTHEESAARAVAN